MGDFQSNFPLWARRALETQNFPFLLGKNVKLTIVTIKKVIPKSECSFPPDTLVILQQENNVMFIKFLGEVSPGSEMMLPNLLMFLFGKQKGTDS